MWAEEIGRVTLDCGDRAVTVHVNRKMGSLSSWLLTAMTPAGTYKQFNAAVFVDGRCVDELRDYEDRLLEAVIDDTRIEFAILEGRQSVACFVEGSYASTHPLDFTPPPAPADRAAEARRIAAEEERRRRGDV